MRFPFLVALVTTIVIAGVFWYQSSAATCPVPLGYQIGTIDAKFALDQEAATRIVKQAEDIWETQLGRELFFYDETGPLTIDFVYDERQAGTEAVAQNKRALDAKQAEMDELQGKIDSLQKEYEEKSASYEERVRNYEAKLQSYNDEVNRYNDQGGAPTGAFEQLEAKRRQLDSESAELNQTASTLNTLANTLNELGATTNELVDAYNRDVEAFNEKFGFSKEFTQGDYHDGIINIYEFSNEAELLTVLVHEFGHALGIDHVDDSSSVMYYLLENPSNSPVLSEADKTAFVAVCGTGTERPAQIRRLIREFLHNNF